MRFGEIHDWLVFFVCYGDTALLEFEYSGRGLSRVSLM